MTTTSTITPELLDQLLANYKKPEDLTGEDGLFKQLRKALIQRALGAELTEHLGYEKGDPAGRHSGNSRNGTSSKTVLTEDGEIEIAVPRDRAGSFEPQLIGKGQTRFDGFDDKILSLYARGMTVREIQGHLAELYGTEVSPDLISRVTDAVLDEVREWQNRPLDRVYPVVFFDALRVKIRDEGLVKNKAVYVALALNPDGEKSVLGLWIEHAEGAKFWLKVVNELKARGVNDILIAERRSAARAAGRCRSTDRWRHGSCNPCDSMPLEYESSGIQLSNTLDDNNISAAQSQSHRTSLCCHSNILRLDKAVS